MIGALVLLAGCSGGGSAAKAASSTSSLPGTTSSTAPPSSAVTTTLGTTATTVRRPSTTVASTGSRAASVSGSSGHLTVTMSVAATRAQAGAAIEFTVTARDDQGFGFFGYQLTYGDGNTEQNEVPHSCPASGGSAGEHSWHFTHQYQSPGTYTAFVHMLVTCVGDQLTTSPVTLVIS